MQFGLQVPENLSTHRYYGYRGIDKGTSIDVPPDRATYKGQPHDTDLPHDEFKCLPFIWWLDTVALPKLNKMVADLPNDEVITVVETTRYKAYARRAGGYVYMGAWEIRDRYQYDEYEKPTDPEHTWSGKGPIPDLGTKVEINFNGLGEGVVHSYFVEHGYIGVRVKLDNQPDWHKNQGRPPYAMVFGIEINIV